MSKNYKAKGGADQTEVSNQNMKKFVIQLLFTHQLTLKMFHFETKAYGAHKAADKYLVKFTDNLDRFMEVFQGAYGGIDVKSIELKFNTVDDATIDAKLAEFVTQLTEIGRLFQKNHDLLAIRDEMMADTNQLRYLLTFK